MKTFVIIIAAIALSGCAALSSSSTNPNTVSLPSSQTTETNPTTQTNPNAPEPGPFHGSGTENIGTITVPPNTVLKWTCPDCGSGNFIINNDANDASTIDVNGLNQTSGQTVVDGGTYHHVEVIAEGNNWTLTFEHQ